MSYHVASLCGSNYQLIHNVCTIAGEIIIECHEYYTVLMYYKAGVSTFLVTNQISFKTSEKNKNKKPNLGLIDLDPYPKYR